VVAVNIRGDSVDSLDGNGATIFTNPDAPLNLANDPLVTSGNQIGLTWLEGVNNGGTPVIDYKISYAEISEVYATLDSGINGLSYTASNLQSGVTYKFKIQARNDFGYSVLSAEVIILAAQTPLKPDLPTTTFNRDTVLIQWVEPTTGGSAIIGYRIYI
jgi:hypothetical protein